VIPVVLESPYAAPTPEGVAENILYARRCVRDCLARGESPYASHLLLTQPGVLRDEVPEERELGIRAGLAWHSEADYGVAYLDRLLSSGMIRGIDHAVSLGRESRLRWLERPTVHRLKTVPVPFDHVARGLKTFEIRRNDRAFRPGHVLRLSRFDGERFTGEDVFCLVRYVMDQDLARDLGVLPEGHVAMGLMPLAVDVTRLPMSISVVQWPASVLADSVGDAVEELLAGNDSGVDLGAMRFA
jgi:hypothetical protein